MNELKPEDVMRALELHADCETDNCFECPYEKYLSKADGNCVHHLTMDALALIREKDALLAEWDAKCNDYETALMGKDAEIERLMREKTALECVVATARNQGRAEAITEFAERLKEGMQDLARIDFGGVTVFAVGERFVDRIAKEMEIAKKMKEVEQ